MANYNTLKASIAAAIKQNGNNEITGNLLQQQLLAMVNSLGVGYQFMGVATPATNPGTPDYNVFYFAGPGTYPNFNGAVIPPRNVGLLSYNGSWHVSSIQTTPFNAEIIVNDIIQLYDGSTPVYPRTRAEAVFFDNDTAKTLDQQFSQLAQEVGILENQMFNINNEVQITSGGNFNIPVLTTRKGTTYNFTFESNKEISTLGLVVNSSSGMRIYWDRVLANRLYPASYTADSDGDIIRFIAAEQSSDVVLQYTIVPSTSIDKLNEDISIIEHQLDSDVTNGTIDATAGNALSSNLIENLVIGGQYKIIVKTNAFSSSLLGVVVNSSAGEKLYWAEAKQNQVISIDYTKVNAGDNLIRIVSGGTSVLTSGTIEFTIKKIGFTDIARKSASVIVVDINGNGDYTSVQDAIDNAGDDASHPKTIIVLPGKYEMPTKYNGIPKAANRYLSIIGTDKNNCVLYNTKGDYQAGSAVDDSLLQLAGNCYIANLTLISTSEDYVQSENSRCRSYCLHLDAAAPAGTVLEVNNCILKNDHCCCIGAGLRSDYTIKIVNCEIDANLISDNYDLWAALFCHDGNGATGVQKFVMANNKIKCNRYAVRLSNPYHGTITSEATFNVCDSLGASFENGVVKSPLSYGNNVALLNN